MKRVFATGKRKSSVARVILQPGTGKITVNKRTFETYFKRETTRMIIGQALDITNTRDKYDILVNVCGGGLSGQGGAVKHGISRALVEINEEYRPILKKAGFLTRDARVVERKKPGQPGARKRYQYSKR